MKKLILILIGMFLFFPSISGAEDFLGALILPQGEIILKTDTRLELVTSLSHDEIITFYKEALKEYQDIKFRDRKDATYIEDDGRLPWHSITISKSDQGKTTINITKDSWTWIIGTLIIRYIGVFVVLLVLFIGMMVSGEIISRMVKKVDSSMKAWKH